MHPGVLRQTQEASRDARVLFFVRVVQKSVFVVEVAFLVRLEPIGRLVAKHAQGLRGDARLGEARVRDQEQVVQSAPQRRDRRGLVELGAPQRLRGQRRGIARGARGADAERTQTLAQVLEARARGVGGGRVWTRVVRGDPARRRDADAGTARRHRHPEHTRAPRI